VPKLVRIGVAVGGKRRENEYQAALPTRGPWCSVIVEARLRNVAKPRSLALTNPGLDWSSHLVRGTGRDEPH
jgi:hypothetical protein